MVGCYAIRKLSEARKVSDELAARSWEVTLHPLIATRRPDIWARVEPRGFYDLTAGESRQLGITELCNQIIHSYIWTISATEELEFDGIYVASDRQRTCGLYFVHVDRLIELFRMVGEEDIVYTRMERNQHRDLAYVCISNRPLADFPDGGEESGAGHQHYRPRR